MSNEELMTRRQIAERFQVNPRTVEVWEKSGMPYLKINKVKRYIYEEVLDWTRKMEDTSV